MEKRIYRPLEAVSAEEVQRILASGTRWANTAGIGPSRRPCV